MKSILLTFDIEEFDLPKEFNTPISDREAIEVSKRGLLSLLTILKKHQIKATFFITSVFAKNNQKLIKNIQKIGHEIACHGHTHSDDYSKKENFPKIRLAKETIERIVCSKILGFRAPRYQIKNIAELEKFGFVYDSSSHPTWIPGRYCNLFKKRKIYKIGNITEIPISTLPICRAPIFWLAFKNFPLAYSKIFTKINFFFSTYNMLVFHPWEFADLSKLKIPSYIKKKHGRDFLEKLEKYILFCKNNNYSFSTIKDYLQKSFK